MYTITRMMYTDNRAEQNNRATIKHRPPSGETGQRRLSIVDAVDDGPAPRSGHRPVDDTFVSCIVVLAYR